ncbi:hypothetical protein HaLaN_21054, partial [Haematococcus lacustris]
MSSFATSSNKVTQEVGSAQHSPVKKSAAASLSVQEVSRLALPVQNNIILANMLAILQDFKSDWEKEQAAVHAGVESSSSSAHIGVGGVADK